MTLTIDLTNTQQKIMDVLSDGAPHRRSELIGCLPDDLAENAALKNHLSRLRKKLPRGVIIDCVLRHRQIHYRLARTIHINTDD